MTTGTPSRKEAREAARAERHRREEELAHQEQRKRRLIWAGGIGAAAIAIVAVVIALASGGGESNGASEGGGGGGLAGVADVRSEFAGIPQNGNELGEPSAPATMMIFADLQCPFCAEWENNSMAPLVERYVKTGKLKMVFQTLTFVGPDSETAGKAVAAAAQQDKLFQYASIFYRNQGEENTGYVTAEFINDIAAATPGLDVTKWKADLASSQIGSILSRAQTAASTANIDSTPSFLVGKTGEPLARFQPSELNAEAFYKKLDALTS